MFIDAQLWGMEGKEGSGIITRTCSAVGRNSERLFGAVSCVMLGYLQSAQHECCCLSQRPVHLDSHMGACGWMPLKAQMYRVESRREETQT